MAAKNRPAMDGMWVEMAFWVIIYPKKRVIITQKITQKRHMPLYLHITNQARNLHI
jgi:hypothetical protein